MKTPVKSQINFNSAPTIKQLIHPDQQVVSALLFSGQLECELSFHDVDFIMSTNRHAIYEFWECFIKDPYRLAETADSLHEEMSPQLVYVFQNDWPRFKDPFFRSSIFFLLNKYSVDGTISHGNFNTNNYSPLNGRSMINFHENNDIQKLKLKYYKAEKFHESFEDLKANQILFIPAGKYSPSPLANQTFAGHDKYVYNEKALKRAIYGLNKNFILVYKYHPKLVIEYKNFKHIMVDKLGQPTTNSAAADELIITNLEL